MLSSQELEQLLKHTQYNNSYEDDSDGDQDAEPALPICLPAPLLLVGDGDSNPCVVAATALPLSGSPQPPLQACEREKFVVNTTEKESEFVSQSENNISDTPLVAQPSGPHAPPPYTPADNARVAAEMDCCSAIEKAKVKTVMCLNYMHGRRCRFGAHCAFAHGADELRQAPPEMMAKKQAIVTSTKPPLTATPPPSYREALAVPQVESPELGAIPAYEEALREQHEHLPPPPPTEALLSMQIDADPAVQHASSAKRSSGFPGRQRPQGSGGNARMIKSKLRHVRRSPV
ncbi:putative zinc finger protein 2 [Leptomonas pyrrhocoris]|uniref:Putative zinc finger protein 2 n=1 Tax=Leptomonas pyrrhocoris TaxID=157538 RepID=A0A0N1J548_LEPPY|nr:putative zinc finger protein 2 [Leptomonas pyrrhocoris]KPA83264.1 putative zinc finger protein 2 [Leptomonas pyrrhocoris]|eukprot:XP_015661703.1 putative zinc finger protein 2 [Leptomonas pyrrhocoris]